MQNQRTTTEWRELDAAHHLHPFTDTNSLNEQGARVITKAEGIYLFDSEGNKILDGMAGLWCVNIGYGRKDLPEVAKQQMEQLAYYNTFFKTTHPAVVELSHLLSEVAPEGFKHVFYTNSGSESVDTMIRMVRRYWDVKGKKDKKTLIGRWNGYHGSTIGGASLGGMTYMHEQGDLPIPGIVHVEQPWWYKHGKDMTPEEFGLAGERGNGLLRALLLGKDIGGQLVEAAREMNPTGLLLNAPRPNILRFMPALNVTTEEIDTMIGMLRTLLKAHA